MGPVTEFQRQMDANLSILALDNKELFALLHNFSELDKAKYYVFRSKNDKSL